MGKLEGKIALITGATSGMGRAAAYLLSEEGATVIIVGRNDNKGKEVVSNICKNKGNAEYYRCDVSLENEISKLYRYVSEKYGKLDILFNNAGVWITEPLEGINEELINKVFSVNFNSIVLMTKYFITMLSDRNGSIINNASIGGLEGYTCGAKQYLYHSSKSAIVKFSKLTAKNYASSVRVNCICPGLIETDIFENKDFSRFDGMIPMGRMGKAEEVAKLVLFLASEDACYITGAVIPIDGGVSLT